MSNVVRMQPKIFYPSNAHLIVTALEKERAGCYVPNDPRGPIQIVATSYLQQEQLEALLKIMVSKNTNLKIVLEEFVAPTLSRRTSGRAS